MIKILIFLLLGMLLFSGCSYNMSETQRQEINESTFISSNIHDGEGNSLSSYYDGETNKYILNMHDADVNNKLINSEMHRHTGVETFLVNATTGNGSEIYIYVNDSTGFVIGDYLHIENGFQENSHPKIIAITGNKFTLDRRIDFAHPINTTVKQSILNLASAPGTLTNPVKYWIGPPNGEVWYITRLLFSMELSTAGDLGKFGNLAPLTNGVLLRSRVNGSYNTITNWKVNSEIKKDMFNVEFDTRSGGGGTYGMSGRYTFNNNKVVIRLDGNTSDKIELYVQDTTITGINSWFMNLQGYLED